MIFALRSSVRSLWSPVVVLTGLLTCLLGVAMVTHSADPGETPGALVGRITAGLVCVLGGVALVWGGARMGVFPDDAGVKVRAVFGRQRTYHADEIAGFCTEETEHRSMPLMLVRPCVRLTDGSLEGLDSLSAVRAIPGTRRQALAAASRLSEWTDRPVLAD